MESKARKELEAPKSQAPLWVFKIGGSLHDKPQLRPWLNALATYGSGRVVIVPGGGPFADAVRRAQRLWEFSDLDAHHMALQAMEQFGRLVIALEPRLVSATIEPEIFGLLTRGHVVVWFPTVMVTSDSMIEPSWDVTSDSLSAWLAARLGAAHLALVKSVEPPPGCHSAEYLVERDIVDRSFPRHLGNSDLRCWWLGAAQSSAVAGLLAGAESAAEILG